MMNFRNIGSTDRGKAQPTQPTPSTLFPLTRQQSVYSLTFDEFQNTLGGPGKDFGSMNMDEFLRNIWTAEETQAMASALGSTADSSMPEGLNGTSGLQRQGSLTLPRTLSQKTVDEVWKDLLKETGPGPSGQVAGHASEMMQQRNRQPTLGEMTLEEFLVRAGVVREENNVNVNLSSRAQESSMNASNNSNMYFGNGNPGLGLGFGQNSTRNGLMVASARPSFPPQMPVGSNMDLGIVDPGVNNVLMSGVPSLGGVTVVTVGSPDGIGKCNNGDLSSLSPVPYHVFGSGTRGRKCSGAVEKVVERRQRRMIKNRESAARSRARKQAYTMELEAEVAKLKEQNQELEKKQAEIMEMQKNQVMEMMHQQRGPKKLCLRRTQTGPW